MWTTRGPKTPEPTGYEARFGFDRRTALVVAASVVFVALMIWLPTGSGYPSAVMWFVKVAGLLLFGVGGLIFALAAARGGVALGIDHHGITLGNPGIPQPGMTNRPVHARWNDVTEVVLFDQYHAGGRQPYIGIRLRPGAQTAATTFNTNSRLWNTNRNLMGHVPEDVLMRSRPVTGWRLDEQRLSAAVATYAPDVQAVRLDETGTPHPLSAL